MGDHRRKALEREKATRKTEAIEGDRLCGLLSAVVPEIEYKRVENERINSLLRDYEPDNSLLKEAK